MLRRLLSFLRAATRRERFEADMAVEIETHIQNRADDLATRDGLAPDEALRRARIEFGSTESHRESCRQSRGLRWLDEFTQDVRYALRTMQRNPGFTAAAVISLALGTGANTAIFSLLDAVLLRTLPVERPHELYSMRVEARIPVTPRWSGPMFERLRETAGAHASMAAMSRVARMACLIPGQSEATTASVQLVGAEYFGVLGVQPAIGRVLIPSDTSAAVISHSFWQTRFGGSPDALGSRITLNGAPLTIVGIAPEGFTGVWLESPVSVWAPLAAQQDVRYAQNYSASEADFKRPWLRQEAIRWLELIVRPLPGHVEAARTALEAEVLRNAARAAESISNPAEKRMAMEQRVVFDSFAQGFSGMRKQFGPPLIALMATVAAVLLIACANLSNLLLARAAGRQREIAVRLSIGAGRGRLIRQLLTESISLALLGGIAGLVLTLWASRLLVFAVAGTPGNSTPPLDVGINSHVLLFTILISMATGLLFGLVPSLRATVVDLAPALKAGGRSIFGWSRFNLQSGLVAAQIAVSVLLIASAGLFLQSFRNLMSLDPGFETRHGLYVDLDMRQLQVGMSPERLEAMHADLIQRVSSVPGVRSAAVAMCGLATGCRSFTDGMIVEGYTRAPGEQVGFQMNLVTPAYFETVGMRLVEGRFFTEADSARKAKVAIVNEAAVRRYFRGRSPVGMRFGYNTELDIQIVGVVRDARINTMREAAPPMFWQPIAGSNVFGPTLHVRTAGDPAALIPSVRGSLSNLGHGVRVDRIVPLDAIVERTLSQERLVASLTSVFGGLALALACFGLYGVMSYAVSRRTAELGVRLALGASRQQVLWHVLGECLRLAVLGIALGVPASFIAGNFIADMLYSVKPTNGSAVAVAAVLLAASAAISGYLPAWRASRVSPVTALRYE